MPVQNLKDFKILSEDDLMKLSLERLDVYYSQLDQWEQEKVTTEKKKRDQAHLRLVDRKRQEEKRMFRENQAKKLEKDSAKEAMDHRVRFDDEAGNSGRSATGKRNPVAGWKDDDVDQSKGIDPRLVFSCVEVPTTIRPLENGPSTSSHGPRPSSSLPQWKNDGMPLPYVTETEPGIAYPATVKFPTIYYLEDQSRLFTSEEVARDKEEARKHPNNPVHKYTVAKDGCIYHSFATWKPSRDRCTVCVKDKLHCWRRAASNARRCLHCNYRKAKCQSAIKDKSESSHEEGVSDAPSPTRKSTRITKVTKRKRAQIGLEDDSDEGELVWRSRGRPKVSKEMDVTPEGRLAAVLSSFKEMVEESARHHAALESILTKTMEGLCTQNKGTRKGGARR